MTEYKAGDILNIYLDNAGATAIIITADDKFVRIQITEYAGVKMTDWEKTIPIYDIPWLEQRYAEWRKTVELAKKNMNNKKQILQLMLDHMDIDYEDYDVMRQAFIERIKELFEIELNA